MNENLKGFLNAIASDPAWTEQFEEGTDKGVLVAAALEKASELGIPLTEADFETPGEGELCEDELAAVAGGGECVCFTGGGGTGETFECCAFGYNDKTCACVVYGQGNLESCSDLNPSRVSNERCICFVAGAGETTEIY